MQLKPVTLKKSLNKAYRKDKVLRADIERFKAGFRTLLERINTDESEENAKFHLAEFLNQAYYQGQYLIATKGRADLVIHNDKTAQSTPGVLMEAKRPRAANQPRAADMIRMDKPNVKALHELILYFLRERIEHHNIDLKYLVITDVYEWFIFDAADFERLFYKSSKLRKDYQDWRDGRKTGQNTDFFYQEIAQPFVDTLEDEVNCTHFDLRDFARYAQNDDPSDDDQLIPFFKILSPAHLLRLSFANDSNSLDKVFYYELLHLIGLEETKEGSKKVIRRKVSGERHSGSLLENAIRTLETEDRLRKVPNLAAYGRTKEEQLFAVALELCITWVNRILFLKLLEAQLLKYHKGDRNYRFLNLEIIADYDELNELFFEALAKKPEDRPDYVAKKFSRIPYLNSSLFEISELEDATIRINSMKDRFAMPLLSRTVLKNDQGKRRTGEIKVLDYLFAFLDAYDFSSEGSESIQEENKGLINASVLGLIFEKINGYQDGAFFTPGFITMYMCRETLRRATVQKFRDSDYFSDFDSDDFSDLENYLSRRYSLADLTEANQLINRLKICDPAVGSGHFLVSALNELIAIKSELGILLDRQGKPLPVRVEVANDELVVLWRQNDELFEYRPGVSDSQKVQEALFHEKQTLIEGCLFGVDINPNSVKICRLRLWVELLKNAYYMDGSKELETLPNIDINIKQGNSLVSRFALDEDLKPVLAKSNWNITDYRLAVTSYQHATNKEAKRELLTLIDKIKGDFQTHIYNNDKRFKDLSKLRGQRVLIENKAEIGNLFEKLKEEDIAEDLEKLKAKIRKLEAEVEEIRDAAIYKNAFEWRFEFPEVLGEEGEFIGFDAVLGNPPYIRQEEFSDLKPYLKESYEVFAGTADLLVYFIEKGIQVLRPNGQLSFIISNKFMRAGFGRELRAWLNKKRIIEIIDFGDTQIFEEATTYPCIMAIQNANFQEKTLGVRIKSLEPENFTTHLRSNQFYISESSLKPEGWNIVDGKTQNFLIKLSQSGVPLGDFIENQAYYGLKTGLNEAFVINYETREKLIKEDNKYFEVIKPFLTGRDIKRYEPPTNEHFIILFPKGWTKNRFGILSEEEALIKLIEYYPGIIKQLLPYKEKAKLRSDQGDFWWELRACDYYKEFRKSKIIYQVFQTKPTFFLDIKGYYVNNAVWFIPSENKTLLAILNSKLGWFLISHFCTAIQNGFQLIYKYLKDIPVLQKRDQKIEQLVDQIQGLKENNSKNNSLKLEFEIDLNIYKIYQLTWEEIKIIDPEFPLTEKEYETFQPQSS